MQTQTFVGGTDRTCWDAYTGWYRVAQKEDPVLRICCIEHAKASERVKRPKLLVEFESDVVQGEQVEL